MCVEHDYDKDDYIFSTCTIYNDFGVFYLVA